MKHQVRKWLQCILQKNKSCSMMLWSSMRLCLQWLKVLYILRIDVETLKCSIRRTVPEAQGDEVLCFFFHLFHSIWSVVTISFTETCPFFKGSDNFCFKNPSWKKDHQHHGPSSTSMNLCKNWNLDRPHLDHFFRSTQLSSSSELVIVKPYEPLKVTRTVLCYVMCSFLWSTFSRWTRLINCVMANKKLSCVKTMELGYQ